MLFSFTGLLAFYLAKALRYAALGRGTLGPKCPSPGVSIPRTPKRLGARPETPPVMLRYVSVAFLLPLIKENIVLSETKHLLQCLTL